MRDESDFTFYHASPKIVKAAISEVGGETTFILLKDFDEGKAIMVKELLTKKDLKAFLRLHEFPIVSQCTEKALGNIRHANSERTLVMLLHSENDTNLEQTKKDFKELATEHRSKELLFIMSNITDGECKKFAEDANINDKNLPTIQLALRKNGELLRYEYTGAMNIKGMKKFYKDWKDGRAERAYKSEDIPAENSGPVYTVVGKTFDSVVLKSKEDVFVKYYAPWCGHCKHLEPVYEELAKKMKKNENLKLVQIDSTKNEIPGIQIQGYPTLMLYRANDKKNPITYNGPRTLEEMEKFLKEQSSFAAKSDL